MSSSTSALSDPHEYQKIFHWAETQKDGAIPSFNTRRNDPYEVCVLFVSYTAATANVPQYQSGFGNSYVALHTVCGERRADMD